MWKGIILLKPKRMNIICQPYEVIFKQPYKAELEKFELKESVEEEELFVKTLYSLISAGTKGAAFTGKIEPLLTHLLPLERCRKAYSGLDKDKDKVTIQASCINLRTD